MIKKIALYDSSDTTETPTLKIEGITNTPSITGLTNGNVQITTITDESIDEIIISNVNTDTSTTYNVIGSIKLEDTDKSASISGIGNTFDIGTITTPGSIETLKSENINKDDCLTNSNDITLSPPPKSLTLVFNGTSEMTSIKI